ncbi:AMP-binding protein [Ideonella sp. 4Y11]|uniref:AMP-binding protein n=1 Tax=Ideonella aquatica TaxID=2824119 RepID=A0A940YLS8_9BURK|nr:AMP-binding protein [Ideonella aquatica]MBQ0960229.1 AMP-binding protein [Ideonella aquatica]
MIAGRLISWAAAQHGERPSLVFGERCYSHREVEARSNRFAQALIALGLQPGERFAVLLENSPDSLDSLFGAEKAALTCVALNARHTLAEHLDILADAQASAVLLGPQFAELAGALTAAAGQRLPALRLVLGLDVAAPGVLDFRAACAAAPEQAPAIEIGPQHLVRIAYTSGTTGQPKGVAYTQERLQARLTNHFMAMEYGLSVDDAMLHVGPLTHAAGVYLFPCFLRGARNVILDRFDPRSLLAAVEQHRITHLMLVPTMMSRLVEAIEQGLRADWSSLVRIHYGTAPTPVALIRRALRIFGPILRQQYGMTEAVQPLTVLYPHEHLGDSEDGADEPIGSCGRPSANVRIVLRDPQGRPVPPGEVGEVTLAHEGAAAVQLWRRPELMAELVRDGWFHSGDLGRFDRHGFLHIVGRNKDMIISGGFNVYAREVEDALAAHPAVLESAVLGLPDAEWGEVVAAAVVLRDGAQADAAALQAFCAERIAGYKKPRRLVFVSALPRNGAGKVMKAPLRERFG